MKIDIVLVTSWLIGLSSFLITFMPLLQCLFIIMGIIGAYWSIKTNKKKYINEFKKPKK